MSKRSGKQKDSVEIKKKKVKLIILKGLIVRILVLWKGIIIFLISS